MQLPYHLSSRSGYIWIWSGARDQKLTNHNARFAEWKSRYITKNINTTLYDCSYNIVIPLNSNTFSDWRRTCHVSLVKTSWRPRATTTWTFDSHVIRSYTFETAANLFASRVKQVIFYAVMAAKRFQTRTEDEIEQLLHEKSSKSTNKATDNAVRTRIFNEVLTFVI